MQRIRCQLAVDDVPVHVEERQRLEAVGDGVGEQPAQRAFVIGRPPRPGDHRVAVQLDARERHAHVRRDDPADADGERLLEHEHPLRHGRAPRAPPPAGTGGTT